MERNPSSKKIIWVENLPNLSIANGLLKMLKLKQSPEGRLAADFLREENHLMLIQDLQRELRAVQVSMIQVKRIGECSLTITYTLVCGCGEGLTRGSESSLEGRYVGFHCPVCSAVIVAHVEGNKRYRRSKTIKQELAIFDIFREMRPTLTVRQLYYALTVRGVVPKDESGYRQTCNLLANMREDGVLPYGWIADNTRWRIKPTTYTGLDAALDRMQQFYRRDLWAQQDTRLEIWVEKDALAGVISPITNEYDVPLFVARGYGSMTFIYDAAEAIKETGKLTYVYHFGDFDPSGVDAALKIRDGLLHHGARIDFVRAAITEAQIEQYNLPTRPTKKKDPRAFAWGDKPSVELDALPAPVLRQLVAECIKRHIDPYTMDRLQKIEKSERKTLGAIRENLVQVQESFR
jgi:hypothetical protein